MSIQVKGTVIQILKPESGVSKAGKEWKKQEFVIETNEQFPKKVCFTLFGDKTSLIDGLTEGTEVEVFFSVESRDFNGKWFHNINAWKIETANTATAAKNYPPDFFVGDIPPEPADDNGNDLPF
jgi:fructose-1,6-bisphosphatase